jgi:hypothetical protein
MNFLIVDECWLAETYKYWSIMLIVINMAINIKIKIMIGLSSSENNMEPFFGVISSNTTKGSWPDQDNSGIRVRKVSKFSQPEHFLCFKIRFFILLTQIADSNIEGLFQ